MLAISSGALAKARMVRIDFELGAFGFFLEKLLNIKETEVQQAQYQEVLVWALRTWVSPPCAIWKLLTGSIKIDEQIITPPVHH